MDIAPSVEHVGQNLIPFCSSVLRETLNDAERDRKIHELGDLTASVEKFVRGYTFIDDPSLDTDDEILNWTFDETYTDLRSAIWLLASGFYKGSAASLRSALEIATAALYFQVRENSFRRSSAIGEQTGWNKFYAEWDIGKRSTPHWGEMRSVLDATEPVVSFKAKNGSDPVASAYDHFRYLCDYTHTSAYDSKGHPVTASNSMKSIAPAFDIEAFGRGCSLAQTTMAHIAMLWQATFPAIAWTRPLTGDREGHLSILFPGDLGRLLLDQDWNGGQGT